ncbi:uncharacterized protein LOC144506771 [Mustelus asterias]
MEKLMPIALLLFTVLYSGIVSVNGKPVAPNENIPSQLSALKLAAANTEFALRLYRQIAAQPSSAAKNIFFSPLSISAALSMLSLGARENTRDQLLRVLGYSNMSQNDAAEVHATFKFLLQKLSREDNELNLTMGSSLHIQQGFNVKQKFVADAKQFYKSEAINVNFKDTDKAKEQINTYVSKKTHGEIQEFIKSLDARTVLLLLNYVLFQGSWTKSFDPRNTYEADFHVDDTTTVNVQMMEETGMYHAGYDDQLSSDVISVPYNGNASLVLILPAPGKLAEVEQNLTVGHFQHFFYSLRPCFVGLHLPKMSLKESYTLNELLKSMGITDVFSNDANLSGISENDPLQVSKVTHEAVLKVDEKGTKATAVTGVEITLTSAVFNPEYIFNRPFLLLIVDHNIVSVLFAGRVMNPTVWQEKMKAQVLILLICGEFMLAVIAREHQPRPETRQRKQWQRQNFGPHSEHGRETVSALPEAPNSAANMRAIYTLAEKNSEFGFDLYRKIANLHEDNVFFSPITVSTALAMMSLGAKQATRDDIHQGLNVGDLVNADNPYQLDKLFQWLQRNISGNAEFRIAQGSSLFVQDGINLKQTYVDDLSNFYHADIITVNFQETANAKGVINHYINNRTNGKISKLLDTVDRETKLMFTNYILFKGKWMAPFDPNATADGTFYVNAYNRITVPMMFKEDTFFITEDDTHSCTILKIPYRGSASMLVLLSKDGQYLHLEDELTEKLIAKWIKKLKPKRTELYFPKFKLNKSYNLERKLRQMGMMTPFTNAANFSGISSSYRLKISKVIHKAAIDVDERGTEAAAVTGVSAVPYSLPPVIKVDHPFIFMIYEEITKTLLFIGRVKDPTKL